MEARTLMLASNNVLFPASGEPSIVPSQDVVLGLYYATRDKHQWQGRGHGLCRYRGAACALDAGEVELTTKINVRMTEWTKNKATGEFDPHQPRRDHRRSRTAVGNPAQGLPFANLNKALKKKEISKLINVSFRKCGLKETVVFADKLLQNGFRLATKAGISIAIDDMLVPPQKVGIIARAESRSQRDRAAVRLGSGDLGRALQQGGGHLGQGR
jgi:DNA-directed RNA polymerase subunit beta'